MFKFQKFDPCPLKTADDLDENHGKSDVMALDIVNKFAYYDEDGKIYSEYLLPSFPEAYYCGGYIGKIGFYRDPKMLEHFRTNGVNREAFQDPGFPILATQAPQVDYILYELIMTLLEDQDLERVKLFDLGCTMAEHYDLLDVLLKAGTNNRLNARESLQYTGLDYSGFVLSCARLLHIDIDRADFELVREEGSAFEFEKDRFDVSYTMSVVNHVHDPAKALKAMLDATRWASAMQLWVTSRPEGWWGMNHSAVPFYFFSQRDLMRIAEETSMTAYVNGFKFGLENTQPDSFIGAVEEDLKSVGTYEVIFSAMPSTPLNLTPLAEINE